MNFWEVRPLSKATIKQAVKLAKTMTAYETAKKKVPLKLVIQFCDILDITEEAEPFDAKIRWPKPRRYSVASRSFSRLVQFEAAYFGTKIEATRYTDHEPKWLRSLSDQISDRPIEESNFPVPRFSVTLDGKLLDSIPMDNERPPLVYDRQSGKWRPFTGTLREGQDALAIPAEEAALCCIRPSEITSSANAVQQSAAKGDAGQSPERGPLLTMKYPESDNSLPLMTVEYPDPYQWLPVRLWPALMRATPNSYATVGVKQQLRDHGKNILRTEPTPASGKPTPKTFATQTGKTPPGPKGQQGSSNSDILSNLTPPPAWAVKRMEALAKEPLPPLRDLLIQFSGSPVPIKRSLSAKHQSNAPKTKATQTGPTLPGPKGQHGKK